MKVNYTQRTKKGDRPMSVSTIACSNKNNRIHYYTETRTFASIKKQYINAHPYNTLNAEKTYSRMQSSKSRHYHLFVCLAVV